MNNSTRMRLCALLAGAAISVSAAAQETIVPAMGGNGGSPFRLECPPNSALIGVDGRIGAIIDNVYGICRPFADGRPAGRITLTAAAGGTGGLPPTIGDVGDTPGGSTICGSNNSVVTGMAGSWGVSEVGIPTIKLQTGPNVVHEIVLRCERWDQASGRFLTTGTAGLAGRESGSMRRYGTDSVGWCPAGMVGVGLVGRSGIYVDNIALLCRRVPAVSRVVLYSDADKGKSSAGKGGADLAQKIITIDCPAKVQAPPAIVGPAEDWAVAGWPNLRLWKATTDAKSIVCHYVTANDRAQQPDTWRYARAMPAGQRCNPDPAVAGRVLCSPAVGNADRFQYQGGQGGPQPPRPPQPPIR